METIILDMCEDRQIIHFFGLDAKVAELCVNLGISVIFMSLSFA